IFMGLIFTAGYVLGGVNTREAKTATGLAAAARNVGAALPAASMQSDPKVIVMILVGTLTCLLVSFVAVALVRHRVPVTARLVREGLPQPEAHAAAKSNGDGIWSVRR